MEEEIYQSRLQIVLLSPNFLAFVYKNPGMVVGKLLHPDRVLAVMLGVKDSQILPEHRAGKKKGGQRTNSNKAQRSNLTSFSFRTGFVLTMDSPGGQRPRSGVCTDCRLLLYSDPQPKRRFWFREGSKPQDQLGRELQGRSGPTVFVVQRFSLVNVATSSRNLKLFNVLPRSPQEADGGKNGSLDAWEFRDSS